MNSLKRWCRVTPLDDSTAETLGIVGGRNIVRALKIAAAILVLGASSVVFAGKLLTTGEVRTLLVGNTEAGIYVDRGRQIAYFEYYREDGRIKGIDAVYGQYDSLYDIREDGCFFGDYPGDQNDGCYYFEHLRGNQYRSVHPDGSSRLVTILDGDPKNLNR